MSFTANCSKFHGPTSSSEQSGKMFLCASIFVQIDETACGKRKYNKTKRRIITWAIGGVEMPDDTFAKDYVPRCFAMTVPNRSRPTLIPVWGLRSMRSQTYGRTAGGNISASITILMVGTMSTIQYPLRILSQVFVLTKLKDFGNGWRKQFLMVPDIEILKNSYNYGTSDNRYATIQILKS